ncbi:MAG: hypothetical protein PV344_03815 [Anaplasma sp.]|nr:hypothetical protein [Anaplasma sp.]
MRQPLIRITCHFLINHFHSTRDVAFHVSVVGCLEFPREVM